MVLLEVKLELLYQSICKGVTLKDTLEYRQAEYLLDRALAKSRQNTQARENGSNKYWHTIEWRKKHSNTVVTKKTREY